MSVEPSRCWRRLVPTAAVAALALVALPSCGGDDDTAAAGTSATGRAARPPAAATAGDLDAFCQAQVDVQVVAGQGPDFAEGAPAPQQTAAVQEWATALLPLAEVLSASAPAEVRTDIDFQVDIVRTAATTGDGSAFESPEFTAADQRVHAGVLQPCGWNAVAVEAADYHFMGVPDTLPAGATSFEIANTGQEFHVAVIVRKNDGVTESTEELLALPGEEAMAKVTEVGAGFAPPGGTGYVLADLAPGDYLMLCPIPVGMTGEDAQPGPDAPPHFTQGMLHAFTVS